MTELFIVGIIAALMELKASIDNADLTLFVRSVIG